MSTWRSEVDKFKSELAPVTPRIDARKIFVSFVGFTGSGKSVTAGICALGITPVGDIGWIDGEGKRSGWAIDEVARLAVAHYGGKKEDYVNRFKVIHMAAPYHPLRGAAAIEKLQEVGCRTIVCDVMSQLWDSDGGYLDMKQTVIDKRAGNDDSKRQRLAAAAAAEVKPWTHGRLVGIINESRCHMVLCFQAKQKFNPQTHQPDQIETAVQESGLTRLAMAVGRVEPRMVGDKQEGGFCFFNGQIREGLKTTHPSIAACLPKNGDQFTFKHAEALARLCGETIAPQSPGVPGTATRPTVTQSEDPIALLKAKLWAIAKPIRGTEKKTDILEAQLRKWGILPADVPLANLTEADLKEVIDKTEIRLSEMTTN